MDKVYKERENVIAKFPPAKFPPCFLLADSSCIGPENTSSLRHIMSALRLNAVLQREQYTTLCHFNTEEKKKTEIIPFPGPSPNPNCKHKALTIWLRVTADDCGAINRL